MKKGMGRWRRKEGEWMEGRVSRTIEEWREMVGKRGEKRRRK
jgi:hypothetical protein